MQAATFPPHAVLLGLVCHTQWSRSSLHTSKWHSPPEAQAGVALGPGCRCACSTFYWWFLEQAVAFDDRPLLSRFPSGRVNYGYATRIGLLCPYVWIGDSYHWLRAGLTRDWTLWCLHLSHTPTQRPPMMADPFLSAVSTSLTSLHLCWRLAPLSTRFGPGINSATFCGHSVRPYCRLALLSDSPLKKLRDGQLTIFKNLKF